jgi:hypothetical protein
MGYAKYREDDLDRRIENRAAILDKCQPGFTQADWRASLCHSQENDHEYFQDSIERAPQIDLSPLLVRDKIILRIAAMKLNSGSSHLIRDVLSDTPYWSPTHFEELAHMSPQASAQLNIALARAHHDEPGEQEPSFRAFAGPQRAFVVETRKRRQETLHLRHPDFY